MEVQVAQKRINEVTRQIVRLYHDNISVEKVVELMSDQNISAEFVESIYNELSEDTKKSTTDRFHYYNVDLKEDLFAYTIDCWTSRYLINNDLDQTDSAFHKITIFDLFNDKSM
jgi:hypothetical protein